MGSSRVTLNAPDWRDVTSAFLELGRTASGYVTVTLSPTGTPGRPVLVAEAQLLREDNDQAVVRCLASARVRLPAGGYGALETALLSLGYELDKDWFRRSEGLGPKTA